MKTEEFKRIRNEADLSNVELARYLGVTDVQVRNYLSGRRDILTRTRNQMLILDLLCNLRASCKDKKAKTTVGDLLDFIVSKK